MLKKCCTFRGFLEPFSLRNPISGQNNKKLHNESLQCRQFATGDPINKGQHIFSLQKCLCYTFCNFLLRIKAQLILLYTLLWWDVNLAIKTFLELLNLRGKPPDRECELSQLSHLNQTNPINTVAVITCQNRAITMSKLNGFIFLPKHCF